MATQRITLAKVAGDAGAAMQREWDGWCTAAGKGDAIMPVRVAVESFAERLRSQAAAAPVVYYVEWIDRWSFTDDVFGQAPLAADRFEILCFDPDTAATFLDRCRKQHQEHRWLAARLRECMESWEPPGQASAIFLVRELLGPSLSDREIEEGSRDTAFLRSPE